MKSPLSNVLSLSTNVGSPLIMMQRYVTFTTLQRSYLDEPATRRQRAQIPVQIGPADEVDDGIYASAVGSIKRSIEEVVFAVVHPDRTPKPRSAPSSRCALSE